MGVHDVRVSTFGRGPRALSPGRDNRGKGKCAIHDTGLFLVCGGLTMLSGRNITQSLCALKEECNTSDEINETYKPEDIVGN